MTRMLVFAAATLSAFGLFVSLLMLGSWAKLGTPMPLLVAMLLSALLAPLFGWRFERLAMRALRESSLSGARYVAMQTGPVLGNVVQDLARLSLADASVLFTALEYKGPDNVVMMTSPGSPNDRVWSTLTALELMGKIASEPEVPNTPSIIVNRYYLTSKGKTVIPGLLSAAGRIRKAAPELA